MDLAMNVVIVRGRLSSPPRPLELDSGDLLVRYEVTVPRDGAPADSVPVTWIGAPDAAPPASLAAGDEVVAVGRVRRRWYRPPVGGSRSATEVAAEALVRATDRRRVKAVVGRAMAALDPG